jgi:hypothetical protein
MNINGSDLILATHGRSFWVLDDIAPLRQAAAASGHSAAAFLYTPPTAVRVDNDGFLGTPMPPEEPQADNPPDGAIVDYYLGQGATKVTLQILDIQGHVLRHFSTAEKQTVSRPLLPIAERWFPKPQMLATSAGHHRFVWDLAAGGSGAGLGDDDNNDEAGGPAGPRVPPGTYTLRLSVDGATMDRPLRVIMDPRAAATAQVLTQQFILGESVYDQLQQSRKAMAELDNVGSQLKKLAADSNVSPDLKAAIQTTQAKLDKIRGGESNSNRKNENDPGLADTSSGLNTDLRMVESGDRTAPTSALEIFAQMKRASQAGIDAWQHCKTDDLGALNAALTAAHLEPLQIAAIEEQVHYAMTR